MTTSTMSFKFIEGEMKCKNVKSSINTVINKPSQIFVSRKNFEKPKKSILKSKVFSMSPMFLMLGNVDGTVFASQGIFWEAFLKYIFPYMLDIAKVFCAIKIAQAFYEERRGGRDGNTGISALVHYGKWYLLFFALPLIVELFDQIGTTMFNDLRSEEQEVFNESNNGN